MLNDYEFRSIWIPKDWDEVSDLAYYTKIHGGPDENTHEHILNNVERCTDELGEVLNNAIAYLRRKLNCPRLVPLMAMPLAEKIQFLADIVEQIPMRRDVRTRIVGDLVYCLWVEGQREKLSGWLTAPNAVFWLKPFSELADCLCTARMLLEETMKCEHKDYIVIKPSCQHYN